MTVSKLHKILTNMIAEGHARKPVAVNKNSFTHPCESDGAVILDVETVQLHSVIQIQEDGSHSDGNGMEHYRQTVVIGGNVTFESGKI